MGVGVVAVILFFVGVFINARLKSDQWMTFYEQCVERTRQSSVLYYKGRPVDWTSSPFWGDLAQICYAKAEVFDDGLELEPSVSAEEYRLWLLARIAERDSRFESDLKTLHEAQ
ncbi:MAG: hypothetical protein KF790_11645 [Steroidobacteraceae bacterium]|nr:hypothetical protein [Steroidobacteraceae bacterium]